MQSECPTLVYFKTVLPSILFFSESINEILRGERKLAGANRDFIKFSENTDSSQNQLNLTKSRYSDLIYLFSEVVLKILNIYCILYTWLNIDNTSKNKWNFYSQGKNMRNA